MLAHARRRLRTRSAAASRPHTGECARSSNSEYTTGVTSNVSSRHSDCPPITTTATVRRVPAPAPVPTAMGIMPATSVAVVIRMGRSRSSQPRRIASSRDIPCSKRSRLIRSICRIEFFLTIPNNIRMPSEL
jgi:hypothetical protein